MYRYGTSVGIAFQIQDDLLDITGDEAVVGKSLRQDLDSGKVTLPLIRYLSSADPAEARDASRTRPHACGGSDETSGYR